MSLTVNDMYILQKTRYVRVFTNPRYSAFYGCVEVGHL